MDYRALSDSAQSPLDYILCVVAQPTVIAGDIVGVLAIPPRTPRREALIDV